MPQLLLQEAEGGGIISRSNSCEQIITKRPWTQGRWLDSAAAKGQGSRVSVTSGNLRPQLKNQSNTLDRNRQHWLYETTEQRWRPKQRQEERPYGLVHYFSNVCIPVTVPCCAPCGRFYFKCQITSTTDKRNYFPQTLIVFDSWIGGCADSTAGIISIQNWLLSPGTAIY